MLTIVGFTGSHRTMTNEQVAQIHRLLRDLKTGGAEEAHHGVCVGADEQFHRIAAYLHYRIIGHPGTTLDERQFRRASVTGFDELRPEEPFLQRNRTIIAESSVMIATPFEIEEQFRGGTWTTIRYARKALKPLVIVWSNGTGVVENVPGVTTLEALRVMGGQ